VIRSHIQSAVFVLIDHVKCFEKVIPFAFHLVTEGLHVCVWRWKLLAIGKSSEIAPHHLDPGYWRVNLLIP
jgi:hypothetical protein